jgi:hypothetical protein
VHGCLAPGWALANWTFNIPPEQDRARFGSAFRDRPIIS